MILANEPNIREVIPVPKTGDARDLYGRAVAHAEEGADEANIQVKKFKVIPSEDCHSRHPSEARPTRRAEGQF